MRNLIIICLLALFYSKTNAQFFPGNDVELFRGTTVKLKEYSEAMQAYRYENLFNKFNEKKLELDKYNKKHILLLNKKTGKSDYNKLVGKEFKVIDIFELKKGALGINYVLKLHNEALGDVYYLYSPKYKHAFELEIIDGLKVPENFYCNKIEKSVDKFDDKTRYTAPTVDNILFMSVVENGEKTIYMSFQAKGLTINVNKKGVKILLKNGQKIDKPIAKVKSKVNKKGKGYIYSSFIRLEEEDIQSIINSEITAFRLYVYDGNVGNGKKLSEYLKCLNK